MCALLDPEVRQWLDIGAEYLTAVGTVGAVIVALYLTQMGAVVSTVVICTRNVAKKISHTKI